MSKQQTVSPHHAKLARSRNGDDTGRAVRRVPVTLLKAVGSVTPTVLKLPPFLPPRSFYSFKFRFFQLSESTSISLSCHINFDIEKMLLLKTFFL